MSKQPSEGLIKRKPRHPKPTVADERVADDSLHGKVIQPLTTPKKTTTSTATNSSKTTKSTSQTANTSSQTINKTSGQSSSQTKRKPNNKPTSQGAARKRRVKGKKKDERVYTSLKNRSWFTFTPKGAATRGSVESDLIRFKIIWAVAIVMFAILVWRAFYLQVWEAEKYIEIGNKIITSERTEYSYRGMITDRNHQPLAVSAPLSTVHFSPHDYAVAYYDLKKRIKANTGDAAVLERLNKKLDNMNLARLATASGISLERLQQAVAIDENVDLDNEKAVEAALPKGDGSYYLPLLNKVTPEIADAVMALDFVGVIENQEFRRYYPQPQPSAQLLGFMGYSKDDPDSGYQGRAGLESQYQKLLSGEDGKVRVLKDRFQNSIEEIEQIKPVVPGKDLTLSIDSRLQYLLYKELEHVGRVQEAQWSTGMVVDVHTGEVLALSTWPSFNNNNLNEMTGNNERNRAVLDVFEPGSVMKPFTVAAALASGQYSQHSLIDTSPGAIRVKGYTIRDHENHGSINLSQMLKYSSNVASTKIALSLAPDSITNIQKQFGFGSKTTLQLPGEQSGVVPTPKEKETARRATVSYGYGLQVTLAQIAQAYATLGAGGVEYPLTLLKRDDKVEGKRVISTDDAMAIVSMMETVTEPGGTGTQAAIDGYRIAGKTGTSRRIDPDGGYYEDQYRTLFAGVAPASNPRLAAVILVEDPREAHYAGVVAAPVFRSVMQEALRLYNVPLDKPLNAR